MVEAADSVSSQPGCLPDDLGLVTGSCLMSKSLLKLHLVCVVFDLKAQPDTLAHWSLIDISVLTRYYQMRDMVFGSLRKPQCSGVK